MTRSDREIDLESSSAEELWDMHRTVASTASLHDPPDSEAGGCGRGGQRE